MIADKLSYFIRTGQMVRLFQSEGFQIDYVQLSKFSPLPGVPAPAPSEEAGAASSEAGAFQQVTSGLYIFKFRILKIWNSTTAEPAVIPALVCM